MYCLLRVDVSTFQQMNCMKGLIAFKNV